MLSVRNPGVVYPVSEDISETDLNTDVDEYTYDGKTVYRGNLDPTYSTDSVSVFWLYDEGSKRVGCAEHVGEEHTCLWFGDTPFGTLLQEDWRAMTETVWSLLSQPAYEDCMRFGWKTPADLAMRTSLALITPSDIVNGVVQPDRCQRCLNIRQKGCVSAEPYRFDVYSTIFVDDDGVLYSPPADTKVYHALRRRAGLDSAAAGIASASGSLGVGC
jgi:hypothetical protein